MVSNSTRKKKPPINALDVRGIQGKLEKVKADVDGIGGKLNETGALGLPLRNLCPYSL